MCEAWVSNRKPPEHKSEALCLNPAWGSMKFIKIVTEDEIKLIILR